MSIKQVNQLLLLLFFSPSLTFSMACGLNKCEDIHNYRDAKFSLENTDLACTTKPEGITTQITPILDSLNPNQNNPKHDLFTQCLESTIEEVEKRRLSDRQNIINEINKLKLNQIPKETQMQMLNTLINGDSFYRYFESQHSKGPRNKIRSYFTFSGPALEMSTALKGEVSQKGVTKKIYEQSGIDVLDQKENPILFLMERMQSDQYQWNPSPQDQNFTPGMSKLILFELIRDFHHSNSQNSENYMQVFNEFAEKMQLGVIIPNEEFENDSNKTRFQYTINDGYFFSAKLDNIQPEPHSLPMSLDCTSFLQLCAFGSDSFKKTPDPLKIVTADFIEAYEASKGLKPIPEHRRAAQSIRTIQNNFNIEPLTCETQLQKGDIVVYKGHTFVFDGYQKDENGQIRIKTIEALGNQDRTLGSFYRDIYDSSCKNFVWGRDDALLDPQHKREAYIVRFKNPKTG